MKKIDQKKFIRILKPLSCCYGGALKLRQDLYKKGIFRSKALSCFVISIGNITAGGTGKTPMTIFLADYLKNLGYKPAVISRGYKGGAEKKGGIVTDGTRILMDQSMSGDEPFMTASNLDSVPVLVGHNRFKSGITAEDKFDIDIAILDDGFQHIKLRRDLNLLLLDHAKPFGSGQIIPAGILREPISAIKRADAFIFTRSPKRADPLLLKKIEKIGKPVFKSYYEPFIAKYIKKVDSNYDIRKVEALKGLKVFVFSGIFDNKNFINTVESFGPKIVGLKEFQDHHIYSDSDIYGLNSKALEKGAKALITTEKDWVRIKNRGKFPLDIITLDVSVCFEEKAKFLSFINNRIEVFYGKNKNRRSGSKVI